MKRGWKITIGVVLGLLVLLILNAIVVNGQTKDAKVNVEGGQIVQAFGGDVQVTEDGPPGGSPIVLLHCYACSLRWWDNILPLLDKNYRVIRIDLLGHGGSEKPAAGYGMNDQAELVASVLSQLQVQGATVVGHSLGFSVATALAERSPGLVSRLVDIDQAPNNDDYGGSYPLAAKLGYVPLIGQAVSRLVPDFEIRNSYDVAFAPGYNRASGFEDPDQPVVDFHAMTYKAYKNSNSGERDYVSEKPLDDRLTAIAKPLLVIFGSEDQLYDAEKATAAYKDVRGAQTTIVEGAGHSPNVEKPQQTAALILEFIANAGDEITPPTPPASPGKNEFKPPNKHTAPNKKQQQAKNKTGGG
jgi:pimeloyl-ACP methyl ester carboxylesterase